MFCFVVGFIFIRVCMYMSVHVPHVCWHLRKLEEDVGSLQSGVKGPVTSLM